MLADWFGAVAEQMCWGLEWSPVTNLSMSFGQPTIEVVREPYRPRSRVEEVRRNAMRRIIAVRGRWWLWLYLAYWSISRERQTLATTSSPLYKKQAALLDLRGQKLRDVHILNGTGATRFVFDLGTILDVKRSRGDVGDIWLFYGPDDRVLSLRGDGMLICETESKNSKNKNRGTLKQ